MRTDKTIAHIYFPYGCQAPAKICRIEYYEDSSQNFFYVFTPDYDVIDRLPPGGFHGIQGLNLRLRKRKYIRKNVLPTFITERAPIHTRENLQCLMAGMNMEKYIPLQWLKQTTSQYFGDEMFVAE